MEVRSSRNSSKVLEGTGIKVQRKGKLRVKLFMAELPGIKEMDRAATHLDENIETPVLSVPAVVYLRVPRRGRHVEQDIQTRRPGEVLGQFSGQGCLERRLASADANSTPCSCTALTRYAFHAT